MNHDGAVEAQLLQALAELRRSYERDAKPYIDRLVGIRSRQTPAPLLLTADQAKEFIELTMSARL